jgi:hypothetical protein
MSRISKRTSFAMTISSSAPPENALRHGFNHVRAHEGEAMGPRREGCAHNAKQKVEVTMTNTSNTRAARIAADQAMINGVKTYLAKIATLPVGSTPMKPADIVNVLQGRISKATAAETAEAAATAAVKADRDERASTASFLRAFRRIVLGMFQESPDTLAAFSMKPPKARTETVATKAAAVAKNVATRKARGTVGPKKKLSIKGTVPASSGAAPAPAAPALATPAPAAAPVSPAPAAPEPTPASKPSA